MARKFRKRNPFVAMPSISSLNCSGIRVGTFKPSLSNTEYSKLMTPNDEDLLGINYKVSCLKAVGFIKLHQFCES